MGCGASTNPGSPTLHARPSDQVDERLVGEEAEPEVLAPCREAANAQQSVLELRLSDRAVSIHVLQRLALESSNGEWVHRKRYNHCSTRELQDMYNRGSLNLLGLGRASQDWRARALHDGWEPLGDLTTYEVVQYFVKPATQAYSCSWALALTKGMAMDGLALHTPSSMSRNPKPAAAPGPGGGLSRVAVMRDGQPLPAFGSATYFVSHAWSYKFRDLVMMLVNHYVELGAGAGNVFYWLDILAVNQHFSGDFTVNPDSDFRSVIATSTLLLTIKPWSAPVTPQRIWCLYEVASALALPQVCVELLVESGTTIGRGVTQDIQQISNEFMQHTLPRVDVGQAQASLEADRQRILAQVRQQFGSEERLSSRLRELLKARMMSRLLQHGLETKQAGAVRALMAQGGRLLHRTARLQRLEEADGTTEALAEALACSPEVQELQLHSCVLAPALLAGPAAARGLAKGRGKKGPAPPPPPSPPPREFGPLHGILSKASGLKTLKLTWCVFGSPDLASAVAACPSLACLEVEAAKQEDKDPQLCPAVSKLLQCAPHLRELYLQGYAASLGPSAMAPLAEALKANCTLQKLGLERCGVDTTGAAKLLAALEHKTSLVLLDLSGNGLGATAWWAEAKANLLSLHSYTVTVSV